MICSTHYVPSINPSKVILHESCCCFVLRAIKRLGLSRLHKMLVWMHDHSWMMHLMMHVLMMDMRNWLMKILQLERYLLLRLWLSL